MMKWEQGHTTITSAGPAHASGSDLGSSCFRLRILKLPGAAADRCHVTQEGFAATTPVAVQREDRFNP